MKLRWGIRGCGMISADFVNALRLLPAQEHQVVALCGGDQARVEKFATDNCGDHNPKIYTDQSVFLADTDIDIVYVSNLNSQHLDSVTAALQAGKHVLCEKPLAVNVQQANQMVECAKNSGKLLLEGYWTRFFPVWQRLAQLVKDGAIGKIVHIDAKFNYYLMHQLQKFEPSLGGGICLSLGCYTYNLAQFLIKDRPVKVHATGVLLDNGIEHSMCAQLKFANNVTASCSSSGAASSLCSFSVIGDLGVLQIPDAMWCPTQLNLYKRVPGDRSVRLEDSFTFPLPENKSPFKPSYYNTSGFVYEIQAVRETIIKGQTECPDMTHEDTIIVAEITDQILTQIRKE